ncbi:MAG: SHOCT domain-containing protein [Actinomycetota bacterium]|jgi:putative membrane protein|nr:SHOCT domain-containing protein [Actinomycetota bacterium]
MCGFLFIFWAALIAFVVWALFRLRPDLRDRASSIFSNLGQQGDSAEEILRRRFARGEIDAEEYERSLEALKK